MTRAAFLEYSFQARIGGMDGVMVAYHNTARIFGFQYVPLQEMDARLYGNGNAGQIIFERCLKLLDIINTEITRHFPEQVRIFFPSILTGYLSNNHPECISPSPHCGNHTRTRAYCVYGLRLLTRQRMLRVKMQSPRSLSSKCTPSTIWELLLLWGGRSRRSFPTKTVSIELA